MGIANVIVDQFCYDGDDADFSIFDSAYRLVIKHLSRDFVQAAHSQNVTYVSSKSVSRYVQDLNNSCPELNDGYSPLQKELYSLYVTSGALNLYNRHFSVLGRNQYKVKVVVPYLVYMLYRCFPTARNFVSTMVNRVFSHLRKRYRNIVDLYLDSVYFDEEIVKCGVLHEFLSSVLPKTKKPTEITDVNAYYYSVIGNIYSYYFKRDYKRDGFPHISLIVGHTGPDLLFEKNVRDKIYKKVLYKVELSKLCESSLIFPQIMYNYNIFKNLIINNELQDLYFASFHRMHIDGDRCDYKVIRVIRNDISNRYEDLFAKLRQLPLIYRLLKCVHIISTANGRSKCYNDKVIKREVVTMAVQTELLGYLKNIFDEGVAYSISSSISKNFVDVLLEGEYINLLNLSYVKINDISFLIQLKQFIRLCMDEGLNVYSKQ